MNDFIDNENGEVFSTAIYNRLSGKSLPNFNIGTQHQLSAYLYTQSCSVVQDTLSERSLVANGKIAAKCS